MTVSAKPVKATNAAQPARRTRFWEIDAWRGVAIITMIVYHLMWDLQQWGVLPDVMLTEGFWKYWQRFTAGSFLLLVGVSMTLVYRRERERRGPDANLYPKFFWRGLKIFGLGMIISTVLIVINVFFVAGFGYIDFGILHLIGFATMVSYPLLPFKWLNLGLWVLFSAVGKWVETLHWDGAMWMTPFGAEVWIDGRWLAPLGVTPIRYPAVDFFPIFPWLGVVFLGIFVGNWFYIGNRRRVELPDWGGFFPFTTLQFLGRHSLLIYMIHQPLLLALLFATGIVQM